MQLCLDRRLPTGFHAYNVKFSLCGQYLAVCGGENYGIKGHGGVLILSLSTLQPLAQFGYRDALFDLCWLNSDPNLLLTGSGDGSIQCWSLNSNSKNQNPLKLERLHTREISSISRNLFENTFSVSSWDGAISVVDVSTMCPKLRLQHSPGMVYEAAWCPSRPNVLASVSESGHTCIWSPSEDAKPTLVLPSAGVDLLSCDWSHSHFPNMDQSQPGFFNAGDSSSQLKSHSTGSTQQDSLITASADGLLTLWDLRYPIRPFKTIQDVRSAAIRKVRFSPFLPSEVASVSYDFGTRIWDVTNGQLISAGVHHSEFVYGVDYSHFVPGLLADCAWDSTVNLYKIGNGPKLVGSFDGLKTFPKDLNVAKPMKPLPPLPPVS